MASAVVTWTPNSTLTTQQIQYKTQTSNTWNLVAEVDNTVGTYTITGLSCGVYYNVRISGVCVNSGNLITSATMTIHC